jgi:hypothetical protein
MTKRIAVSSNIKQIDNNKAETTPKRSKKASKRPKRSPAAPPKLKPAKRRSKALKRNRRQVRKLFKDAPAHIALGSPAFAKLQTQWYAKLKQDGFSDLEWHDPKSGYGQNSPNLKQEVRLTDSTRAAATELWFRLWTNYYTWNVKNFRDNKDRLIVKLYSDGLSYRQIAKVLQERGNKTRYSLYYVFSRLNHFKDKMLKFNREHREGLLKDDLSQDSPTYVVALEGDIKPPWLE